MTAVAAVQAAGHGALSTGLPGPVLIVGAVALVAAGMAIGLGIPRYDQRDHALEVDDAGDAGDAEPSNVTVLEHHRAEAPPWNSATELHMAQAVAAGNDRAPLQLIVDATGGAR